MRISDWSSDVCFRSRRGSPSRSHRRGSKARTRSSRYIQLHAASMTGEPKFRKKLSRRSFPKFMAEQPPAMVVMEACGSAHYWAREMTKLGHEVKLIAPRYVKPFVKRQKNDAADAEAIVVAAQRPEMRFVDPKSAEQQSRAILFRSEEHTSELQSLMRNSYSVFSLK